MISVKAVHFVNLDVSEMQVQLQYHKNVDFGITGYEKEIAKKFTILCKC